MKKITTLFLATVLFLSSTATVFALEKTSYPDNENRIETIVPANQTTVTLVAGQETYLGSFALTGLRNYVYAYNFPGNPGAITIRVVDGMGNNVLCLPATALPGTQARTITLYPNAIRNSYSLFVQPALLSPGGEYTLNFGGASMG